MAYLLGGEKTFPGPTRTEALQAEKDGISKPKFAYHDQAFGMADWTKEPSESLATLYRQRAEALRAQYDYLILAYSGGIDSTNVLESFALNNIPLDEILMVGAFSQDNDTQDDTNHNGEIYLSAWPTLRKLGLKTKITSLDYSLYLDKPDNFSLIAKHGNDWVDHVGSHCSIHQLFWHDLGKFLGDGNKNTGLIFGLDKPNFGFDNYCFGYFHDHQTAYGMLTRDAHLSKISFYSSPQAIDLIKKQLHIVKRFFDKHVREDKTMTLPQFEQNYFNIVDRLIYKLQNPLLYKSEKSTNNLCSVRDVFFQDKRDLAIFDIWKRGIAKTVHLLPRPNHIKLYQTRRYYLEALT